MSEEEIILEVLPHCIISVKKSNFDRTFNDAQLQALSSRTGRPLAELRGKKFNQLVKAHPKETGWERYIDKLREVGIDV